MKFRSQKVIITLLVQTVEDISETNHKNLKMLKL